MLGMGLGGSGRLVAQWGCRGRPVADGWTPARTRQGRAVTRAAGRW